MGVYLVPEARAPLIRGGGPRFSPPLFPASAHSGMKGCSDGCYQICRSRLRKSSPPGKGEPVLFPCFLLLVCTALFSHADLSLEIFFDGCV